MPRVRRKRVDVNEHSHRTRTRLETGHDWEFLDGVLLSEDELREAWEDLRDELLEEHIRDHPGRRPWAWWEWDSPSELRLEAAPGTEPVGDERWFGKPRCYAGLPIPEYESDADYLERHDLLTEAERKALGRPQPAADDGGDDG